MKNLLQTNPYLLRPTFNEPPPNFNLPLTPAELTAKQRLQWRRNQQKCRERKRQRIRAEKEFLTKMKERINYLEKLKTTALTTLSLSEPLTIVSNQNSYRFYLIQTYYTLFQHGLCYLTHPNHYRFGSIPLECPYCPPSDSEDSEMIQTKITTFIENFLTPNVNMYHAIGIESFWDQWRAYSTLFDKFHVEPIDHKVLYSVYSEYDQTPQCLIRSTYRLYMTISKRTLEYLMPSLSVEFYPTLVGKTLILDGYSDYYFNRTQCIKIDGERQMIPCLMKALNGNLKLTLQLFQTKETMKENGWIEAKAFYKCLEEGRKQRRSSYHCYE